MDAAAFLKSVHAHLAAILAADGPAAAGELLYYAGTGEMRVVRLPAGAPLKLGVIAGVQICTDPGIAFALISLEAMQCEECPAFDWLVSGTFFERGAPIAFRPLVMEWQAPARLGWYEWAGEGDTADAVPLIAALNRELARATQQVPASVDPERVDYVICSRLADDPGAFDDNEQGTCCACGAAVIFRPHAPKRPPRLCTQCGIEMAKAQ